MNTKVCPHCGGKGKIVTLCENNTPKVIKCEHCTCDKKTNLKEVYSDNHKGIMLHD